MTFFKLTICYPFEDLIYLEDCCIVFCYKNEDLRRKIVYIIYKTNTQTHTQPIPEASSRRNNIQHCGSTLTATEMITQEQKRLFCPIFGLFILFL